MTLAHEFEKRGIQKGIQEGRQQGVQEGEATLLLRQLKRRFGDNADRYHSRLLQADAHTLLRWGERVLEAVTLEDVFKDA